MCVCVCVCVCVGGGGALERIEGAKIGCKKLETHFLLGISRIFLKELSFY